MCAIELREERGGIASERDFFLRQQRCRERAGGGGLLLQKCRELPPMSGDRQEKIGQRAGNFLRPCELLRRLEFEQMAQPRRGFAECGVRAIELRKMRVIAARHVRVMRRGGAMKCGL